MKMLDLLVMLGFIIITMGLMYAIVHGQEGKLGDLRTHSNLTITLENGTNKMLYGDNWACGYIMNMTNISSIRDCFRD